MKAEETEVFFISCFLRGVQAHGGREDIAQAVVRPQFQPERALSRREEA
jgi:hypothetical protein